MADTKEYLCEVCNGAFRSQRSLSIHQSRSVCFQSVEVGESQCTFRKFLLKLVALAFCLVEYVSLCLATYFLAACCFEFVLNPEFDITPFIIIIVKENLDPFLPYSRIARWVQTREFTRAVNWFLRK